MDYTGVILCVNTSDPTASRALQVSVAWRDLSPEAPERHVRLRNALDRLIDHGEDQVILVKLGRSTPDVIGGIEVLGRPRTFEPPSPTIVQDLDMPRTSGPGMREGGCERSGGAARPGEPSQAVRPFVSGSLTTEGRLRRNPRDGRAGGLATRPRGSALTRAAERRVSTSEATWPH